MKYTSPLLVTALGLCFCGSVLAGQKVDETLDASSSGRVEIEHVNGKATIKGWKKDQVKVVGELDERAEDFIFKRNGNNIRIKVEMPKRIRNNGRYDGDDLTIYVPHGSRVSYSAINANVNLEEVFGGTNIETINGEIDAEELKGRIRLESVNGGIDTKNLEGHIVVETINGEIRDEGSLGNEATYDSVNGDIEVASKIPDISAETVNGDMELTLDDVDSLKVDTVNGDIESRLTLMKHGEVRANSVGGDIELYFQSGISAQFDIQSHAGGRISNNLTDDRMKKAKYGPRRWLEFTTKEGNARVSVSTVGGSVSLDEH
ncbi:hypothetical protein EYS14_24435 [Alteromonadaceae bacterium M269]|nr:hypothetical protein EYS14_24435 [Alteromonadaceae bacterium M269]